MNAINEAVTTLKECAHTLGFKASAYVEGYPQVWARDSMITLIGALTIKDEQLKEASLASLRSLATGQTPLGLMPNNVDVRTGQPNYQAYADGGLWFIIGCGYAQQLGHNTIEEYKSNIIRCLTWYDYQDVHNEGLIVSEEGGDWEDLFAVRGRGLYVNALHVLALENAAYLMRECGDAERAEKYSQQATQKRHRINQLFWFSGNESLYRSFLLSFGAGEHNERGEYPSGEKISLPETKVLGEHHYYIPYFTFRQHGEWFDSLANLLTIHAKIANEEQTNHILDYIAKQKLADPYPLKAIHPPIRPGEKDWREYYRFADLNLPHQYHNGGIWPFIGGLYVATLKKCGREAQKSFEDLTRAIQQNEWSFNEWLHGESGEAKGMPKQAWSAAMYVYAHSMLNEDAPALLPPAGK